MTGAQVWERVLSTPTEEERVALGVTSVEKSGADAGAGGAVIAL